MITFFVIVYEAYLVLTLSSFEPLVFFIGLTSYWGLLYNGIPKEEESITTESPEILALDQQVIGDSTDNIVEADEEEEDSDEFMFPDTSMDADTEREMFEDESIMSEWSDLLTRRWKTSSEESDIKTESAISDTASTMSRASRFDEEEEHFVRHTSSEEDEEEEDDLGFDPVTLESYLAQYDQIKKDAQLAKELQIAEQKARDQNNPFMVDRKEESTKASYDDDNLASPSSDGKEEWKVRIFPRA